MTKPENSRTGIPFKTLVAAAATALLMTAQVGANEEDRDPRSHEIHSRERPLPPQVDPRPHVSLPAPGDAIVLFDGTDFSHWQHPDGSDVRWQLENDAMRVVPETGDIETRREFGDVRIRLQDHRDDPIRFRNIWVRELN